MNAYWAMKREGRITSLRNKAKFVFLEKLDKGGFTTQHP